MDEREQIQAHKARIAKILESLNDIEAPPAARSPASQQHAVRVAEVMRRELEACNVALSVDHTRLALDLP